MMHRRAVRLALLLLEFHHRRVCLIARHAVALLPFARKVFGMALGDLQIVIGEPAPRWHLDASRDVRVNV